MEFIYEPEFWVAVSFFIFIGVLVYLGVHKKVANELDPRALRIHTTAGKALADIHGRSMIQQVHERVRRAQLIPSVFARAPR